MSKRRKVWWIVGGVLGFVALFFVTALILERNSPNAKLERVLNQIIAEHGFERTGEEISVGTQNEVHEWTYYDGEPISQENAELIFARFRAACPSCDEGYMTNDEPENSIHQLLTEDTYEIVSITFIFDDQGLANGQDSPISNLAVHRLYNANRWSFIRNLWPW